MIGVRHDQVLRSNNPENTIFKWKKNQKTLIILYD
jgi:hypothetical protein